MRAGILRHCRLHMELGKKEQTHGNNIDLVVSARRDRGNVDRGGPNMFAIHGGGQSDCIVKRSFRNQCALRGY